METNLPKVLVVAINAWRKDGTSHTLPNIFSCWDPSRLALIYTRADLPYTDVCSRFFQISENDVLKSIFKPWKKTGREVYNTRELSGKGIEKEHNRYLKARKKHSYFMSFCREMVWSLGHWKSKELKKFVKDFNPDIIFVPIYPTVYMGKIQKFIKRFTKKPIVCYLADDNYSYDACKGFWSHIHRFMLRKQVKYLATNCKEMFVIVDKEKEVNHPIKFVYTGNLIISRDKTLALLADVLNEINGDEVKATLDIYSPDVVDEVTMSKLNCGCSRHRGFIEKEKIGEIQRDADVVVFVEALEGKDSKAARLSFSTKITDYLANGKCILAIGKKDIAPIDYFIKNDSAIVATSVSELKSHVRDIISNDGLIEEYSKKAFDCAKRNHDKDSMNKRFIETIIRAIG